MFQEEHPLELLLWPEPEKDPLKFIVENLATLASSKACVSICECFSKILLSYDISSLWNSPNHTCSVLMSMEIEDIYELYRVKIPKSIQD